MKSKHMTSVIDFTRFINQQFIAVCKDSYVVYACSFDRVGKWEWFCESKLRCKNDVAKMTLQKWRSKNDVGKRSEPLLADGITSTNNPLIYDCQLPKFCCFLGSAICLEQMLFVY